MSENTYNFKPSNANWNNPDEAVAAVGKVGSTVSRNADLGNLSTTINKGVEAISTADFANIAPTGAKLSGLDKSQVTGALAQLKNTVNSGGIGDFGIDVKNLEFAGIIKPGTFDKFLKDAPDQIETILNNPMNFTGEGGAFSLNELIADPKLQQKVVVDLQNKATTLFKDKGIIDGSESPAMTAGINNLTAQFDIEKVEQFLTGTLNDPELSTRMNNMMEEAQSAMKVVEKKIPEAVKGIKEATAYAGTTIRSGIDNALSLLKSDKRIPEINFGGGAGPIEAVDTAGKQIELKDLQFKLDQAEVALQEAIDLGEDQGVINQLTIDRDQVKEKFTTGISSVRKAFPGVLAEATSQLQEVNTQEIIDKAGSSADIQGITDAFTTDFSGTFESASKGFGAGLSEFNKSFPTTLAQVKSELPGALNQANDALPGMVDNLKTNLSGFKVPDTSTIRNQMIGDPNNKKLPE